MAKEMLESSPELAEAEWKTRCLKMLTMMAIIMKIKLAVRGVI